MKLRAHSLAAALLIVPSIALARSAVWVALLFTAAVRRPEWALLPDALKGSLFLRAGMRRPPQNRRNDEHRLELDNRNGAEALNGGHVCPTSSS